MLLWFDLLAVTHRPYPSIVSLPLFLTGNQRVAIMYGGFFDFNRARPGKRGLVPPFPPILERLVDELLSNNYLPPDVRPDSCIINRYDVGDCIPPHVDHASYARPISTLSLLGEEPMLVGTKFRTVKSSTWVPTRGKTITLPRRSLLVLGGNSGNISKHCISACKGERISITLRKQPPPDWKPDESELVGKPRKIGINKIGGGGEIMSEGGEEQQPRKKRKSLSGSAKKRKKMLNTSKQQGDDRNSNQHSMKGVANNAKDSVAYEQRGDAAKSNKKGSGGPNNAGKSKEAKRKEKQARRNARRLEKKRAAVAAA